MKTHLGNYRDQNNKKMKTQITKSLMVIALLASSLLTSANENERAIELTTENEKAVVLNMQNIQEGTRIRLWNESGELLFEDKAQNDFYGKVFNLRQMEEGNFTLEIENEESLEILPIKVTNSSAKMNKAAGVYISKPVVKSNGESLKVYLGQKCLEMQMTIFDQYDDVVHRSDIKKSESKVKRYDVSDLAPGQYKIQFSADGRSFYHTITLN